jgi:hypothetical protein
MLFSHVCMNWGTRKTSVLIRGWKLAQSARILSQGGNLVLRVQTNERCDEFQYKRRMLICLFFLARCPRLLARKENRLGKNGVEEIKAHPFFKGIDWDNIRKCK